MTGSTLEAVYEHGILRPLTPLDLAEGQHVQLTVQPTSDAADDPLSLLLHVLDGLSEHQIAEFEKHLRRPASMFEIEA